MFGNKYIQIKYLVRAFFTLMVDLHFPIPTQIRISIPIPYGILKWVQYLFLSDSRSETVVPFNWKALGQESESGKVNQLQASTSAMSQTDGINIFLW